MLFKKNKNLSAEQDGDDLDKAFKIIGQERDQPRTIGLYGELDGEKGESVVYGLIHLHETRMKSIPRPLTVAQKKKIQKAVDKGEDVKDFELKFDDVPQPIDFIICTPGGRASDMFAIYDAMRMVRNDCDIITFGMGQVMSAGTLLLASGTKGKRKIGKNCRVMVHQVSAGAQGPHHEMLNEIAEIQHTQEQYIRCLAAETKMTVTQIKKLFDQKVNIYMSAEEAVKNGLADIIV